MRAATPATILVLAACIVLVLVTCSTPVIKSFAFLEATIGGSGNQQGQKATLGCLGYCIGNTCKGPTIGYSFDPTQLLGVATSVEGFSVDSGKYTSAVIKALTYTLVLNPIALAACVVTLLTGVLAHCGDMSLSCLNGVFSGLASTISLVACALNFALFVLAKKRIDAIDGASATLGTALWLSLAGWILIVLSSFAFCCGCGSRGGGGGGKRKKRNDDDDDTWKSPSRFGGNKGDYAEQVRMDALQAESDRKRRQNALPKFATFETEHIEELPLKQDYEDGRHHTGYNNVGYADDSSYGHHQPGGAGNGAYIAGVGTGALRGAQPAAGTYYDPAISSHNNLAGHGAHDASSASAYEAAHQDVYGHAVGTPSGMPLDHQQQHDGYFYGDESGAVDGAAGAAGGYGYGGGYDGAAGHQAQQASTYPQQYDQAYHHDEASAYHDTGTRGGGAYDGYESHDQGHVYAAEPAHERSLGHANDYRGAAYGGAREPSVGGRSRQLPTLPSAQPYESGAYTPTRQATASSSHQRHGTANASFSKLIPPPRQTTGDDGFGAAVLQAGGGGGHDFANPHQSPSQQQYYGGEAPPGYANDGFGGHYPIAKH